jgi:hypothetical protein
MLTMTYDRTTDDTCSIIADNLFNVLLHSLWLAWRTKISLSLFLHMFSSSTVLCSSECVAPQSTSQPDEEGRSAIPFKRTRDEYFFEGPKNLNSTWHSAYDFHNFQLSFCEGNSKIKFLLASVKSLINSEIPSGNPLQRACSGFLIAACVSKSCSVTRLWSWKAGYECTLEKIDQ